MQDPTNEPRRPQEDHCVEQAYPLPRPADDPKFNVGLLADVIRVIEQHGYPAIHQGGDIVRLQQALFCFVYGEGDPS